MANEQNLTAPPIRTSEEAARKGKLGGIASGKVRRERKTIADALRLVLDEEANSTGLTRQEAIVARVVKRLYEKGDIRDLKTLADVLGESIQNINVKGVAPIVAKDAKDAAELQELINSVQARKDSK